MTGRHRLDGAENAGPMCSCFSSNGEPPKIPGEVSGDKGRILEDVVWQRRADELEKGEVEVKKSLLQIF